MTARVEHLTPDPGSGRPPHFKVSAEEGGVSINFERESGALWLFAYGPAGGDRGAVVFPPRQAEAVKLWVAGGCRDWSPSTTGRLRFAFGGRLQFRGERWSDAGYVKGKPRPLDLSVGVGPERAAFERELAEWAKTASKPRSAVRPTRRPGPILCWLGELDIGNYTLRVAARSAADARACLREEYERQNPVPERLGVGLGFDAYFEWASGTVAPLREAVVEWR